MSVGRYKVGDKIRIREYDDMAAEWPRDNDINETLNIDGVHFVPSMLYLCGKVGTIYASHEHGYRIMLSRHLHPEGWSLNDEMLIPFSRKRSELPTAIPSNDKLINLICQES